MLQDGYPDGDENTKFLAWQWTYNYLGTKGYAPYTPAVEDMVECGIFQVEGGVKNFAVVLADTTTEFTENPKFDEVSFPVIADILHKEKHADVQAKFLEKGIKPIL
eukprot:7829877-Ditylum_brightwellii.AAC.1